MLDAQREGHELGRVARTGEGEPLSHPARTEPRPPRATQGQFERPALIGVSIMTTTTTIPRSAGTAASGAAAAGDSSGA